MAASKPNENHYATNIINFIGCQHLSVLERMAAQKLVKRPHFDDPMLEILQERGLLHETAYVNHLKAQGKSVVTVSRDAADPLSDTLSAMQAGADVIVQGRLENGNWAGWTDVLVKTSGASRFGDWQYEPVETKLAKTTRGTTLLQLCLYADLLASMQEATPEWLYVVIPERDFVRESYRFDEYRAYFRFVRGQYEASLAEPLPANVQDVVHYPEPVPHCDMCNWYSQCESRRRGDDHLSLVAGIVKTQRKELETWGVQTLAALAALPVPLEKMPSRGSKASIERIREQARLQMETRTNGKASLELLPIEEGFGLAALPPPSPLDVFLDLEGDRQAENGGFDYLFGYAFRDALGEKQYAAIWATEPEEEKRAFETFIDEVIERRKRDATMRVYHYAPYETTSMKRLMGRYGTRADELDELLRGGVFVDLYAIIRRAFRAGIESYSIKQLEQFYGLVREVDLRKASGHLRAVEYAIAKKQAKTIGQELREAVQAYNRDDCLSALDLRDWLETLRSEHETKTGLAIPRPTTKEPAVEKPLDGTLARIRDVANKLMAGLPAVPEQRNKLQRAQWTLAQLLEWHRREDKANWWEFFRLRQMDSEELLLDPVGLSQLQFVQRISTSKRGVVVDGYSFPRQETDFKWGDDAFSTDEESSSPFAEVKAIDVDACTIQLKKGVARAEVHPTTIFKCERISNPEAVDALLHLAEFVLANGVDAAGSFRAARDLLLCNNPRLPPETVLQAAEEVPVVAVRRVLPLLCQGTLAIQGPPGAGKTFAASRAIVDLVRLGKRVGVTAVSHKVIRILLDEVVKAAAQDGIKVRCMHRVTEKSETPPPGIYEEKDSKKAVEKILEGTFDVVGGTPWVWPKEELRESVDYLFVDEAGQMSLANVLACAMAAHNLVLLGDPQQLEQPQKASHPDGAELSALEHLLEGHETMPADRGLFLGETWRLHPAICSFTSEQFYEGKLQPQATLFNQAVSGATNFAGAGLHLVTVEHTGNQNRSVEEADAIAALVAQLTTPGTTWTNKYGDVLPLTPNDVLIVAPYNAQVSEISARTPGARVGTVDKFQGQEAPVVIYSMTTSSAEEAPRGMEFLFSRNRLNVATSRARCVCILVASPQLFSVACKTPEQMRMANAFCRYVEMANGRGAR